MFSQSTGVLDQPVAIVGAGVAGLINAHVLLQDGFTDVTVISRDISVGGTWARHRVYPGLRTNTVHGEYRFSALEMLPPKVSDGGSYLSGVDICDYMEDFAAKFLHEKAKFRMDTEIVGIARNDDGEWHIRVRDKSSTSGREEDLMFARIVLASGGNSNPRIPDELSQEAADKVGYRGLVIHSSDFAARLDDILAAVKPASEIAEGEDEPEQERVLVIGGGKSAQDVCAKLTSEGRRAAIVYETLDMFVASPSVAPAFIRKSRFSNVFSPHITLNTRLERFLHTTALGGAIVRSFWKNVSEASFKVLNILKDSPLRRTRSLYWGTKISDEGAVRPNSFHFLANSGTIEIIAPARMMGYSADGMSILLNDNKSYSAKVIVLATGYQSSWKSIFSPVMAEEIGINRHPPHTAFKNLWNYKTLENGPSPNPDNSVWTSSLHRGLVPAKNIERRDFAIAGAIGSANFTYTNEISAHWIASYFRGDEMRLPSSVEDAIQQSEERSGWMKVRFPDVLSFNNLSETAGLDHFTWPQAADELLEDMHLPSLRSGGNWFNWLFKVIDSQELVNLTDERCVRRQRSSEDS